MTPTFFGCSVFHSSSPIVWHHWWTFPTLPGGITARKTKTTWLRAARLEVCGYFQKRHLKPLKTPRKRTYRTRKSVAKFLSYLTFKNCLFFKKSYQPKEIENLCFLNYRKIKFKIQSTHAKFKNFMLYSFFLKLFSKLRVGTRVFKESPSCNNFNAKKLFICVLVYLKYFRFLVTFLVFFTEYSVVFLVSFYF